MLNVEVQLWALREKCRQFERIPGHTVTLAHPQEFLSPELRLAMCHVRGLDWDDCFEVPPPKSCSCHCHSNWTKLPRSRRPLGSSCPELKFAGKPPGFIWIYRWFIDDLSVGSVGKNIWCQIAGIAWWFVAPLVVLTLLSARHVFHTVAQKRFCLMYFWLFQLLTLSVGPQSRCLRALWCRVRANQWISTCTGHQQVPSNAPVVAQVAWFEELERTVEKFSEILENNLDRSGRFQNAYFNFCKESQISYPWSCSCFGLNPWSLLVELLLPDPP